MTNWDSEILKGDMEYLLKVRNHIENSINAILRTSRAEENIESFSQLIKSIKRFI